MKKPFSVIILNTISYDFIRYNLILFIILIAIEEEPLPEVYIPKVPSKVLMAQYISHNIIWLSMSGFDAGYMYEYSSPEVTATVEKEPAKSIAIYDADDTEIRSCLF
jgi:hypothetical protein